MSIQTTQIEQTVSPKTRLHFHLLGNPEVIWGQTPVQIPRRSVRALLFRLVCTASPLNRQHLHLIFWPDINDKTARRNLSHHLTHLRRALPLPNILITQNDRIWLDPDLIQCDVLQFKRLVMDTNHDTIHLREAVELYRSSFLDGFDLPGSAEFEHWMVLERSNLERLYLDALTSLVDLYTLNNELNIAIRYAQRYLENDDLSEEIHQRLIKLYATSGERSAAIQQFERCKNILERELGVSPLPETQVLYQNVLEGKISFTKTTLPRRKPDLPRLHLPLVGRNQASQFLEDAYTTCLRDRGQVVLISGEVGIGKTRLMRDFAGDHQEQARLLFGSAYAGEQSIPYQPILGLLRSILGLDTGTQVQPAFEGYLRSPPALTDLIEPIWATEISRVLPELRIHHPDLPAFVRLEPESAQARLFEAMSRLFLNFASKFGPVIFCLDDLQWADASTLAWLVHLVRLLQQDHYRMLILGTYRSEEIEAVRDLLHNLNRAGHPVEVHLPGLVETDVAELLQHLIGHQPEVETLAGKLIRASGGNPFYLIETTRALFEAGKLKGELADLANLPLPESVRQTVHSRLQHLSARARQALEAAAILGLNFPYDLLHLTSGRDEVDILAGLEEANARQLLIENKGQYNFIHELTQHVVIDELSYARKRLLNLRAGKAYEQLRPDALPRLAHHFEAGEDWTKALYYHGLAAHQAEKLLAWQEAEYHQSRVLDLLEIYDPNCERPDCIRQRAKVLGERANTRYLQGRLAERDNDLRDLEVLGESSADKTVQLKAFVHRVRYLNLDGEYNQAIELAHEGLDLINISPELNAVMGTSARRKAQLLAQVGFAYYFLGEPRHALNALRQAQSLELEADDPEAFGRIQNILGYVHFHLGDFTRSLECQQQAYECHKKISDYHHMARDMIDIGALHKNLGNLEEARRYLYEGVDLANRIKARPAESYGLTHLGSWDLYIGDYYSATTHYRQALEMEQELQSEHMIATNEAGVGLAFYHLGDYAKSRTWLKQAMQRAEAIGHRRRLAETLIELGLVDLAERNLSAAHENLETGLALARDSESIESMAAGLAGLAGWERMNGDPEQALTLAEEAVSTANQNNLTGCEMWAEVEVALALLALRKPIKALEHSDNAIRLTSEASQDWFGAEQAYFTQAQALRALGDEETARESEQRAKGVIDRKAELIGDPAQRRQFLKKYSDYL